MTRARFAVPAVASAMALGVLIAVTHAMASMGDGQGPSIPPGLRDRAAREGRVKVLVELKLATGRHVPEGLLRNQQAVRAQRTAIANASDRIAGRLPSGTAAAVRRFSTLPYIALEVNAGDLDVLERAVDDVAAVVLDEIVHPVLSDTVPLVQADQAWQSGYDGTGTAIAVLDSGVDSLHPFLAGKVVDEACYSSTVAGVASSFCPNGQPTQLGPGSAAPCSLPDCAHGTHVAGIAAGSGTLAGQSFSGVAPGAQIVAVQVFTEILDATKCPLGQAPCVGGYTSDVLSGLDHVFSVAAQRHVVAVNMSLGSGSYSKTCDREPYKPAIDNLRSINIASVVASGNSSSGTSISSPACVSTAVSVGSTSKTDQVSYFSNISTFLSLLAPGESITSSVPGGTYDVMSGTSMAAPHVAGAWSVLKQAAPGASVSTVLGALRQTGLLITDNRLLIGKGTKIPRIRIFQALATIASPSSPVPSIGALSPAKVRAGSSAFTLTITGTGFNALSVLRWNGSPRPTVVSSTTSLSASIAAADVASVGTAQVSVVNPAPGGGTSDVVPLAIDPPPSLSVSASTVGPGGGVTVTLNNGFGGAQDWIALAAVGSPDTSYIAWTYAGSGNTPTWTVSMPTTAGSYEFRLFLNNGYTRAATSPSVVVDPTLQPTPIATSLSPASITIGSAAFTLTVTGSGFVSSSVVLWNGAARPTTYVSATQLQAAIPASDVASVATVSVRVQTPAPGGGLSGPLSFSVVPGPSLAVSATSVAPGAAVTVTLVNGGGGSSDWLAFASTSAGNGEYLQWTYVGAGVTTRTWTVNAPSSGGTYEFRLFLNNGYTRAATSPTVTVQGSAAPVLTVNATTVAPGAAVTVTLSNAPGGSSDWLALASTSASDGSFLQWTYVGSGVTTRAWTVNMPTTPGTYEFRLFLNNGYTRAATSPTVTVQSAAAPVLSVSVTTVPAGASVTVTLTNGLGGTSDWLALASTTAADTSYLQWTYVGAGVTTRTWTVTAPSTPGAYEFRLFLNNGYTRAATSPPVMVPQ